MFISYIEEHQLMQIIWSAVMLQFPRAEKKKFFC